MEFPPDLFCWFLCNYCGCGGFNLFNYAALSPAHILTITLGWLKSHKCVQRSCSSVVVAEATKQTHNHTCLHGSEESLENMSVWKLDPEDHLETLNTTAYSVHILENCSFIKQWHHFPVNWAHFGISFKLLFYLCFS